MLSGYRPHTSILWPEALFSVRETSRRPNYSYNGGCYGQNRPRGKSTATVSWAVFSPQREKHAAPIKSNFLLACRCEKCGLLKRSVIRGRVLASIQKFWKSRLSRLFNIASRCHQFCAHWLFATRMTGLRDVQNYCTCIVWLIISGESGPKDQVALHYYFVLVHDSRGIEIVNFTISLAQSAGTLMASAGTQYRLVPAHFYPCL